MILIFLPWPIDPKESLLTRCWSPSTWQPLLETMILVGHEICIDMLSSMIYWLWYVILLYNCNKIYVFFIFLRTQWPPYIPILIILYHPVSLLGFVQKMGTPTIQWLSSCSVLHWICWWYSTMFGQTQISYCWLYIPSCNISTCRIFPLVISR